VRPLACSLFPFSNHDNRILGQLLVRDEGRGDAVRVLGGARAVFDWIGRGMDPFQADIAIGEDGQGVLARGQAGAVADRVDEIGREVVEADRGGRARAGLQILSEGERREAVGNALLAKRAAAAAGGAGVGIGEMARLQEATG